MLAWPSEAAPVRSGALFWSWGGCGRESQGRCHLPSPWQRRCCPMRRGGSRWNPQYARRHSGWRHWHNLEEAGHLRACPGRHLRPQPSRRQPAATARLWGNCCGGTRPTLLELPEPDYSHRNRWGLTAVASLRMPWGWPPAARRRIAKGRVMKTKHESCCVEGMHLAPAPAGKPTP